MEKEHQINMSKLSEISNSSAGLSCSPAFTLNNNAVSFKVKNQQSAKTLINQQKQKHDVESVIDRLTVMYQQEKKQEKAIKTHFYWSLFNTLFCCFFCGSFALINSYKIAKIRNNDPQSARNKLKLVLVCNLISILFGIFFWVIFAFYYIKLT